MPKLRFKDSDGREFPEWELCKLGGLFKERSQRANGDEELLSVTIEQGVLRQNDLARRIVSSEDKSNYKAVYKGDIAYNSMRMWQGAEGVSNYNGIVSPAYTIVVPKENVSSKFFAYMFKTEKALYSFKKYSQGLTSDTWNLKYPLFSKVPSNTPSLPEQQKIADFLTAYDRQIDIQSQRVEAMKVRKKGLLQKIFSQEIRFKDDEGKDYPEWDEKKIGEFSQCIAGATPSTKEPRYWENGNIPWMSSGEVNNRIICSTEKKISSLGYENSSTKMLPENTVVIALAGQGKTRGMVAITRIRLCTNQSLCGIVTDSSILSDYLYQFLLTQYEYLRLISSGDGTRGGLNLKIVKDCNIPVPTLPEQQKIADFLTAVDKQIEVEEKRLKTMKTIKKGLLQQMFI